jgi:L-threonylcarbamoyladenylate synthase
MSYELSAINLKQEKTILYPTDTIWGIGCDATCEEAIQKIYTIKQRPTSKQFIVLFSSIDMLSEYLTEDIDLSFIGTETSPTTYILNQKLKLPSLLISEENTVAIRIPKNQFCIDIITELGKPIVSTSANVSGELSPINFESISDEIKNSVDYIVPSSYYSGTGSPSKIIIWKENQWITLR